MTPEERDRMNLEYLINMKEEPDMSPEAVTKRMEAAGELGELSRIIKVPYIFYLKADYKERLGRDNSDDYILLNRTSTPGRPVHQITARAYSRE